MDTPPFFLVLIALCLLCSTAAAAEISAGSVSLDGVGQTATVPITLDQAANGIAGYTLDVSVANPSVAEIVGVDYPAWASLSQSTSLPAGEVRLKAVDINREVEAGATNIPIATVTVKSQSAGSTTLQVIPVRLSDDSGGGISAPSAESALTVAGSGSGSSSPGSGSSSGSSSGSGSTGSSSGSSSTGTASSTSTGSGISGAGSTGSPSSGKLAVQPVHTPESWASGSSGQGRPAEQAQGNGNQVPPAGPRPGTTPDWFGANLVLLGIGVAAVVLVLVVVVRMASPRTLS
jgi:hypothetical protein